MSKNQYLLMLGLVTFLSFQQERIRQRQRDQFNLISNIVLCLNHINNYIQLDEQIEIDEEFEEIIIENFEEGLE